MISFSVDFSIRFVKKHDMIRNLSDVGHHLDLDFSFRLRFLVSPVTSEPRIGYSAFLLAVSRNEFVPIRFVNHAIISQDQSIDA